MESFFTAFEGELIMNLNDSQSLAAELCVWAVTLKGAMAVSSGTGCSDFCPVNSLRFTRASLGKRDHKSHVYTACWTNPRNGSQENLGSLWKTRRIAFLQAPWPLMSQFFHSTFCPPPQPWPRILSCLVSAPSVDTTLDVVSEFWDCSLSVWGWNWSWIWDSWWVGYVGRGTSSLWSPVKLRASLCFHATVGILKGPVSTPYPPSVKLFSGTARAIVVLCIFCPCLVYFSGSRVRIGIVVG